MNEENFKKGIEKLKNIRMTDVEKARVLKHVLSAPSESPYMKSAPVFAFVYTRYTHMIYAFCLILIFSLGGAAYVSGKSLPGDLLYPIKTMVVEPVLDVVNRAPEKRIVWEEEKVSRRIVEAEKLEERNELDDERVVELERRVEESSKAFIKAVEDSGRDRVEDRKNEFRKKFEVKISDDINDKSDDSDNRPDDSGRGSRVNRLKRFAVETIDIQDDNNDRSDGSGNDNLDSPDSEEDINSKIENTSDLIEDR